MTIEIKVPDFEGAAEELLVAKWLKQVGDPAAEGESVVILELDKIAVEIPAPQSGWLREIVKEKGDTVRPGEVLATLKPGDVPAPPEPEPGLIARWMRRLFGGG